MTKLKHPFAALVLLMFIATSFTAAARLRLIRAAHYTYNGSAFVPADSFIYNYIGYRTGSMLSSANGWTYAGNYDTTYLIYRNSVSGKFFNQSMTVRTYDSNGNMLTQLFMSYDTTHNTWHNSTQTINTYDAHNNLTSTTPQYWNKLASAWQNNTKTIKTYDGANNNITDTTFSWMSGSWVYNMADSYSYDSHNNLLASLAFIYSSGSWLQGNKIVNFLNAGYVPDSTITYSWNSVSTSWQYYNKENYTYDASYNKLTDTTGYWNSSMSSWMYNNAYLYTYSGSDPVSKETEMWTSASGWKKESLSNMAYDGSHNLLETITKNWRTYKAAYENASRVVNTYNSDNKVTTNFTATWDTASSSWLPVYQLDQQNYYYYESYTGLAVNNIVSGEAVSITLYPCPANNYVNVALNNPGRKSVILAVYDLSGKLYKQWEASATDNYHASVSVSNLPAGNYIMEARCNNQQSTKQFSVVH